MWQTVCLTCLLVVLNDRFTLLPTHPGAWFAPHRLSDAASSSAVNLQRETVMEKRKNQRHSMPSGKGARADLADSTVGQEPRGPYRSPATFPEAAPVRPP